MSIFGKLHVSHINIRKMYGDTEWEFGPVLNISVDLEFYFFKNLIKIIDIYTEPTIK